MSIGHVAVYPGTFDPMTNGHTDIIERAARLVDRLIVGVAVNVGKSPLFTLEDRVAMVNEELGHMDDGLGEKVEVVPFDNLLIDFVREANATMVVRGLRAVSDFEYEFQMAGMNKRLDPQVETVFLMASDRHQFIASRFVKEIGRLGGDVGHFVSSRVKQKLVERVRQENGG